MMTDLRTIRQTAEDARAFLEPRWRNLHSRERRRPEIASEHMCRVSTFFLKVMLERTYPDISWKVQEGLSRIEDPDIGPGGIRDANGDLRDHFWIEGERTSHEPTFIVDVTADQFGHDPVFVGPDRIGLYHSNMPARIAAYRVWSAQDAASDWIVEWEQGVQRDPQGCLLDNDGNALDYVTAARQTGWFFDPSRDVWRPKTEDRTRPKNLYGSAEELCRTEGIEPVRVPPINSMQPVFG